jgi:hypothetical protein
MAFTLAAVCFAMLWVHVLWREAPRGLTQKVVIVLILGWLALASTWLRRGVHAEGRSGIALPAGELP